MSRKKKDSAGPTDEEWKRVCSLDSMLESPTLSHPGDNKSSD